MSRLIALDPASRTGVAIGSWGPTEPRSIETLTIQLPPKMSPAGGAATMCERLVPLLKEHRPDMALIEEPVHTVPKNVGIQNFLWALHGGVCATLTAAGVSFRTVLVHEWRSAMLGDAKIPGPDAKRRCLAEASRMGHSVKNHDEGEAFMLLCYLNLRYRRWAVEEEHYATADSRIERRSRRGYSGGASARQRRLAGM